MDTHRDRQSRNAFIMPFLLSLGLAGCAAMTPSVPVDVAQRSSPAPLRSATFLSFTNGAFEAGEYKVSSINYGVVRSETTRIGPFTTGSSSGSFSFLVAGPRAGWTAECGRGARSKGIAVSHAEMEVEKTRLHCELVSGSRSATLELLGFDNSRHGSIRMGETRYSVRQYFSDNMESGKFYVPGPLGLRIDRNGENVAALQFSLPGTFWINRTLAPEQQDALAGILAAMLIEHRRNGI